MTKSHATLITVKAYSYGGLNFLIDALPDLICNGVGCAIKTYEYLWEGKVVTLEACAANWLVDRSYNRLEIVSDGGVEASLDYDIDKDGTKIISCDIGDVVYEPFTVSFAAYTWYSSEDLTETCKFVQHLYKREGEYTQGYFLRFPFFGVPYCLDSIGESFRVDFIADVVYRGSGVGTSKEFKIKLIQVTPVWGIIEEKTVTAEPGGRISYSSTLATFEEDLQRFALAIYYYNEIMGYYVALCSLYWRIKKADHDFHTSVDIYTEQP